MKDAPVPQGERYESAISYQLLLASVISYLDLGGIPLDSAGYINLGDAVRSGKLNLVSAIEAARITSARGARILAKDIGTMDLNNWQAKAIDNGEDQAVVFKHGNQVIVGFRGTHSAEEWIRNAEIDLADFKAADGQMLQAHKGFLHAINGADGKTGIGGEVEKEAARLLANNADAQLYVTGHSLGGAMALLYAMQTKQPFKGIYTYGQPRAGNEAFAEAADHMLAGNYFRIVGAGDMVPHLPPQVPIPYKHAGTEEFIDRMGRVMQVAGKNASIDNIESIMNGIDHIDELLIFHDPSFYAQPLQKNARRALHTDRKPGASFTGRVTTAGNSPAATRQ